jgi:hypothetical protein
MTTQDRDRRQTVRVLISQFGTPIIEVRSGVDGRMTLSTQDAGFRSQQTALRHMIGWGMERYPAKCALADAFCDADLGHLTTLRA